MGFRGIKPASIKVGERIFEYCFLPEVVREKAEFHARTPAYVFDSYGEAFVDSLYLLQHKVNAASVLVLFKPDELDRLLRHINIFTRFSFTLVPEVVSRELFEKIYEFFFFSPLSESYITWAGSLVLRYRDPLKEVFVTDKPLKYEPCPETCILRHKNCTKGALSTFLIHPFKEIPSEDEMDIVCEVQMEFTRRAAVDIRETDPNLDSFDKARRGVGIRNQYWLDPYGIF